MHLCLCVCRWWLLMMSNPISSVEALGHQMKKKYVRTAIGYHSPIGDKDVYQPKQCR
jgi:hypothetical protein